MFEKQFKKINQVFVNILPFAVMKIYFFLGIDKQARLLCGCIDVYTVKM